MTKPKVVETATAAAWESLLDLQPVAKNSFDNVRLLDNHRRGLTLPSAGGHVSRHESLDARVPTAIAPNVTVDLGFLSRIRAWMLVPPVDFALLLAPVVWRPHQVVAVLAMAVVGTALLTGGARYQARLHLSVLDELPAILTRLLTAAAIVASVMMLISQEPGVIAFLESACQAAALVIFGRLITTRLIAFARRRGITSYDTVLIGGGSIAAELARILRDYPAYGLRVKGFVDDTDDTPTRDIVPRLGRLADLDSIVATTDAHFLLIADGAFEERALTNAVRTERCQAVNLLVVPRLPHFHTLSGEADHIGSIPIMRIRNPNLHWPARLVKRGFDIVVAIGSLTALSPLLLIAALAVRFEGGPGVIFRQMRVGRDAKHFELLKFRTMRPANEFEAQTLWCVASDNRVGPVGRLLRCTSIDELPQLWNILRGDMTLVGPRPERPHFVEQFSTQFDRYADRHRVQAGLTGFAQVSGLRGDTSIADRARFDNFYIENWSLWLDIKIILRTFREVLLHRGS
ncbi:sugar transferase [Mycobacterium sp. B14F4]|uniref:sugar transferase n=1 Tax=Mycobacterium sp. B14F4 TaxID=3153565 RepID=UPI00325ECF86